jgi:predicted RNase H-like HicB family nuclease
LGLTALTDKALRDETATGFRDWLPRLAVRTIVGRRQGQWYAVATDFCVVGMGSTEEAARENLSGLLHGYLRSFYERGRPFHEAKRPIGTLTKMRLFMPLRPRKRQLIFPAF